MELAPNNIYVLVLMLAPIAGAVLILIGKVLPLGYSLLPSFLVWSVGTVYGLFKTCPTEGGPVSMFYVFGGWAEPFGIVLELNRISWAAAGLGFLIGLVLWLHTRGREAYGSSFYLVLYLVFFSLHGVLFSRDLFNLFVWFELLSLCSFVLVAYDHSPRALMAALRYLFLSTVSIIFFLLGIWIFYRHGGSPSFSQVQGFLEGLSTASPRSLQASLAIVFITAGIITRSAVLPFHTWLPPAHAAAPYPVSALLSGFVIKAPLLALWHFYDLLPFNIMGPVFIWLGAASALVGGVAAFLQRDAKLILAYSSVGQIGYIIAAFGVGGVLGRTATLFYLTMHALHKSLLFFTVGHVTARAGTRDTNVLRGMQRSFPFMTLIYWLAALGLLGLPFSMGHYSKYLVSASLYGHAAEWFLLPAGAATAIALFRLGQIFTGRQNSVPLRTTVPQKEAPHGILVKLGLLILTASCILPAIFPEKSLHLFHFLVQGEGLAGAATTPAWYGTSALLKSTLTALVGLSGLFVFRFDRMRRLSSNLIDFRFGLDWSLRLFVLGLLAFIGYGIMVGT